MKSRYMITIFLILFLLGISGFIFMMSRRGTNEVKAVDNLEKYYTSIVIEEGDTLWDIAGEYMTPGYEDREEYIKEVQKMNQMTGSTIRTGSKLLIPYYTQISQESACSE
ncbi:MAG: LysM peptidoglycan-binding domain-containing protein [Lachnospiraceae bacterium]|nr:LysM peptidoglycan-binding domain-containing protein [Lachnospiraceae bacterium]